MKSIAFIVLAIAGIIATLASPSAGYVIVALSIFGMLNTQVFIEHKDLNTILFMPMACSMVAILILSQIIGANIAKNEISPDDSIYMVSAEITGKHSEKYKNTNYYYLKFSSFRDIDGQSRPEKMEVSYKKYALLSEGDTCILAKPIKKNASASLWNSHPTQEEISKTRGGLLCGPNAQEAMREYKKQSAASIIFDSPILAGIICLALLFAACRHSTMAAMAAANLMLAAIFAICWGNLQPAMLSMTIICFLAAKFPPGHRIFKEIKESGVYVTRATLRVSGSKHRTYYAEYKDWNGRPIEYSSAIPFSSSIRYINDMASATVAVPLGIERRPIIMNIIADDDRLMKGGGIFVESIESGVPFSLHDSERLREKFTGKPGSHAAE